jgi:hypothetical protein
MLPRHAERVRTLYVLAGSECGGRLQVDASPARAWLDAAGRLARRSEVEAFTAILANADDLDSLGELIASTDSALPTASTRASRTLIGLSGAGVRALEIALEPTCPFGTVEIWSDAGAGDDLGRAVRAVALDDRHHARPPRVFVSIEAGSEHAGFALVDELAERRIPYCLSRAHPGTDLDERVRAAVRFALLPSCLVA